MHTNLYHDYYKQVKYLKIILIFMGIRCPNCSDEMILTDRYGVEIDHCPRCKGVWLDRGELEKVAKMQNKYDDDHYNKYHFGKDRDYDDDDDYHSRRRHKKKGFLEDMFDFG